jgi:light-harvesting complex I chlorophyll a/b binding protein 4
MSQKLIALALAAGASAFMPTGSLAGSRSGVVARSMSKSVPFLLDPKYPTGMIGDERFDPLGLSENFDIKWLREAELKNGRVAMLACLGFVVQEFVHLPGDLYSASNPLEAFAQVGPSVIGQIVLGMGFVEYQLHKGKISSLDMFEGDRVPGNFGFDPMGLMKPGDPMQYQLKEITNGRLAMLAIGGMVQQSLLTGSGLFGHS